MADDLNSKFSNIRSEVAQYYGGRLREHGATPRGVDWNSKESQELRFMQLLKISPSKDFALNEIGCGFGSMVGYLEESGYKCRYSGFDIAQEMIAKAKQLYGETEARRFVVGSAPDGVADYTTCSGIFNVKLGYDNATWHRYILSILDTMSQSSSLGFSFNALTSYSDADRQREDLYYADPCWFFDYCKKTYSKNVALLHDYGLYEFTILVRK